MIDQVVTSNGFMKNAQVIDRLIESEYLVTLEFTEALLGSRPTASVAKRWVEAQERDALERGIRRNGVVTGGLDRAGTALLGKLDGDGVHELAGARLATSTGLAEHDEGEGDDPEGSLAVTGFSVDPETGRLHLWDFQLMGFLKVVSQTLDTKIAGKTKDKDGNAKSVSANRQIQTLAWMFGADSDNPFDRRIFLRRPAEAEGLEYPYITEPDGLLDRPLRAMTARGERVSIAISEQVEPPALCRARLVLLKGCKISQEQLEDIFVYGMFQGLGQWRSGGFGRFIATLERTR